ncbi:orc1/cdc6 family replication initiation protein [Candidatus Woesearchaeota archaeon]|nr:orc1/cdc6 family replication initiation protein [Nanoarchaeota archaeon]MCB9371005.1 orc1/cdc6 family replication initiation protein [Candidatus Woesearchaeota archaeon]USN44965.1 MAG: orc1/cdc6 family replication initiation protein [Candidatus Woesearchaeota archaeon]
MSSTETVAPRDDLDDFFDEFMSSKPIFEDKAVLQSNYSPEKIQHRDEYLRDIAKILAPSLRSERPSNVFIYGKTGTGKSLCVNHVLNKMKNIALAKDIPLVIVPINCKLKKVADTEYRMLLEILKHFGREKASTGLATGELYKELYECLDTEKRAVLLVLDEIDTLIVKAGDEILYNLTRINPELKNAEVTIVGITNDLTIMDTVDARVKSSLSEEEIVFLPYNAVQIQDILHDRSLRAFRSGVLHEEVIPRCAAYTAREHGDARRALDLLRFAGEIAEREGAEQVLPGHIDNADKRTERNRILDIIKSQPKQFQLVTYSILKTSMKEKLNLVTNKRTEFVEPTTTGAVYDYYNRLAKDLAISMLSLRRISDIIIELEVLGLINFKIVSKGRYGRTRFITVGLPKSLYGEVLTILREDLNLA